MFTDHGVIADCYHLDTVLVVELVILNLTLHLKLPYIMRIVLLQVVCIYM